MWRVNTKWIFKFYSLKRVDDSLYNYIIETISHVNRMIINTDTDNAGPHKQEKGELVLDGIVK